VIPLYMEFATASAFGSLLPCREQDSLKYWEIIADNRSKAGWSWGCVSALDAHGPHGASAVLDAPYEVLADRTLSRAPDWVAIDFPQLPQGAPAIAAMGISFSIQE